MEEPAENPDIIKHETVKRPMNAFLIFCKRHRGLVHEKNPSLDNRSVTRILGDLWANLGPDEKYMYTDLAKQYKEAFLKANPDYKWYNPEKHAAQVVTSGNKPGRLPAGSLAIPHNLVLTSTGISPGKLADPSNMGGLSMLLMAGQQTLTSSSGQLSTTSDPTHTMSTQPLLSRGVTTTTLNNVTDQRIVGLTSSRRDGTSNQELMSSWSSVMPSIKKMDTETETKFFAGRKAEESFALRKTSVDWPMDLSHCTDTFQTSCVESRTSLAEIDRKAGVVMASRDPIATERSPDRREPTLKVATSNELTWSATVNPSASPNAPHVTKPDVIRDQSSGPLSRPLFGGPAVTSPPESDRNKIPFIGHPLTYLFSQPTQQLSTNQRLKILLPTAAVSTSNSLPPTTKVPDFSSLAPNSERSVSTSKSSGVADESKSDGVGKLIRSDLRKFVVEKVIEAAYSKEHEPSIIQSFPKTKKQQAIDKLSSINKPSTPPHSRNGNLELCGGIANNAISRSISVPEAATTFETPERLRVERRPEEEVNASERNGGDVAAMTIGEINEKLIMKVVQEEDVVTMTSVTTSPVGEGRMPLKLQKKYKKKLDDGGVGNSGSSSTSFGSSSPDQSCSSVFDGETSSVFPPSLTSDNHLQFSGSAEKSSVSSVPGGQKVNIFMNANLLAAYPEFLRSGSLLTGERRQMGSMTTGSNAGTIPAPKSSMGVNKLIETLIQESFALHNIDATKLKGLPPFQPRTPPTITTPDNVDQPRPDLDPNSTHPLRHVNKTLEGGAKSLKRKRNRRTESSDVNNTLAPSVEKEEEMNGHVDGIVVQSDPSDVGVVISPKRLRESATTATTSDEACPDVPSGTSLDLFRSAGSSDAVRIAGAWHLIDNILNERAIDSNGGRAREEINNNSREKAMISVDHDGLASSNKALRKSKRANQGLRYKELMSKGVLYASRKSMDSNNILIEDNRDNVDAMNDDEGNDLFGVAETTMLPRRRCHADSTSLDMDTEVGRRYKSGDFDLEAHIACLPACQIEVTDRKSAGKIKSRSHSQSAAATSVSFLRLPHQKRIDLKSDEMKNGNGISLEQISFCKLRRLSRLSSAVRNNLRCLFGSARRKARGYCIVQLLPLKSYHAVIMQPITSHETNLDEHALSSPLACATLTVISSTSDASSFGHQVAGEQEAAFDAQKRELHSSFDILAAAAAVSSSGD